MTHKNKYRYTYDRKKAINLLDSFTKKNNDVRDDILRTKRFIESIFNEYDDPILEEQVNYAFIIPTRATRHSSEYWEEVYEYFPAFRRMSLDLAFLILSCLPPFRIEMYGKKGQPASGVLLFAPIFSDMKNDISKMKQLFTIRKKINDTVDFAVRKFGVIYIGLGATLPKITNYGSVIKANVVTTTGHAGTVCLILQYVAATISKKNYDMRSLTIGFIGGGAIGSASMQAIAMEYPKVTIHIHDKRKNINRKNLKKLKKITNRVYITKNNEDLINKSQIIISAITSPIDVNGLDLTGKTILDDSQPGSFNRSQVINSGGELVWIIGSDNTKDSIVTRKQSYSYGPHGLSRSTDVWGCEAEVAAIAYRNRPDFAVNTEVKVRDIENMESLFNDLGITVADFQSHGTINN